jgi:hypothetical protein
MDSLFPTCSLFSTREAYHSFSSTKIILANTLPLSSYQHENSLAILESLRIQYRPDIEIDIGYSQEEKREFPTTAIRLPIKAIYDQMPYHDKKQVIPYYHTISRFHYQYIYPRYSHRMSYSNYLLLEEHLANILLQFIEDSRNYTYLFVCDDPTWFYEESIFSYLTQSQRQKIVCYLLNDLDNTKTTTSPSLIHPAFPDVQLFLWTHFNHPFL